MAETSFIFSFLLLPRNNVSSSWTPISLCLWHSPATVWSISNTLSMHQVSTGPLLSWNRLILGSCNKQCRLICPLSSLTGNRQDCGRKKRTRSKSLYCQFYRNVEKSSTQFSLRIPNRFFPVTFQIFRCNNNNNNNFLPNIRSHRSSAENVSQWIHLNLYQCFLRPSTLLIESFLLGFYWFYEMTIKLIHSYVISSHKSRTDIQIECSMAIASRAWQDEVQRTQCRAKCVCAFLLSNRRQGQHFLANMCKARVWHGSDGIIKLIYKHIGLIFMVIKSTKDGLNTNIKIIIERPDTSCKLTLAERIGDVRRLRTVRDGGIESQRKRRLDTLCVWAIWYHKFFSVFISISIHIWN